MTHAQLLSPRSQDISNMGQPEQPSMRGMGADGPQERGTRSTTLGAMVPTCPAREEASAEPPSLPISSRGSILEGAV